MRISEKAKAIEQVKKGNNVCGMFGIITELKYKNGNVVSGKGETDKIMFVLTDNGHKAKRTCEIKTNGGRVDNITNSDYIIYEMNICNSTTKGKTRKTEPVIMKTSTFMDILKNCGAIKKVNRGGLLDGHAIQVSNKAFYETMLNYPTKYIQGKLYKEYEIK